MLSSTIPDGDVGCFPVPCCDRVKKYKQGRQFKYLIMYLTFLMNSLFVHLLKSSVRLET